MPPVDQPVSHDRFLGCLLGQTVGDALGAPFEGLPADFVFWHAGPVGELLSKPADGPHCYTDDSQMMIGVAEALLLDGEIRPATLAKRFAENYDPERGYGRGARQILEAVARGDDWNQLAESVFPGGSYGNGGAMRVAPIGIVFAHDLHRVAEQAILSAQPTHRHPLGIEGTRLLALAIALAAKGPPLNRRAFYDELARECKEDEFQWQLRSARKMRDRHSLGFLGNSLFAHKSVVTAIACFTTCPSSFERCIEKAITLGDDTDTLAAMAGALCGAHLGVSAIPESWLSQMERGPKGIEYIRELADGLHKLHARLTENSEQQTLPNATKLR